MDLGHYIGFSAGILGLGVAVVALWRLVSATREIADLRLASDENHDAAQEQATRAQRAEESLLRMTAWADSVERELLDAELDRNSVVVSPDSARYYLERVLRKREDRPDRAKGGVGPASVPIGFATGSPEHQPPGPVPAWVADSGGVPKP